ncbi:hypothetical protein Slin15195_G022410 [Septoria linicola]|uniref:Uncharacterized protein n=1 Tax=Septoria linicola TaxID=215465 RepID=A0A9Q9AGV8_9PEZI|nr:hypothetical protein Slin14017_G021450 [Septoria linicola]USW48922.1 hypothetical protein Slin15195_G022410 [Septoria linicola]
MLNANELQAENERLEAENEQLMHLNLFAGQAWAEQAASVSQPLASSE